MELLARGASLSEKMDAVIRFFLYVLIFWLPYSPAVVECCVIISLVLWILKRGITASLQILGSESKQKISGFLGAFKPAHSFINTPIAVFLSACLLSIVGSIFFQQSLYNFFTKTLEWFIVYFLVIETFTKKRHICIAIGVLLFTSFATAVDSLSQFYFTHKDIFSGHIIEEGGRATAAFKTANGLGGYLVLVIPISLALFFLEAKGFLRRVFSLLLFFIMTWALIVTFSRGAWLGLVLGVAVCALGFFPYKQEKKSYLSAKFLFIVIICICSVLLLACYSDLPLLPRGQTAQWRLSIWRDSLLMIKERPFFGHGINTYMKIFQEYWVGAQYGPTYAHNCYIQLAAETGLVGLFSFLWIIGSLFSKSLEKAKTFLENDKNFAVLFLGLFSGIFAFLAHSFFDTHFYALQLSVYLWFMIGVLVALINAQERDYA